MIWLDLLLLVFWMALNFGLAVVAIAKCEVRPVKDNPDCIKHKMGQLHNLD